MALSRFLVAGVLAFSEGQQRNPAQNFLSEMTNSMSVMHGQMASVCMSGDIDHDFAAMMVPHHNGAIAMARAELAYGSDPVMRRLAQEIFVDQLSEIDAMHLEMSKQERRRGSKRCAGK